MQNKINLENSCSVKEKDFNSIFDDFFKVRNIKQNDLENKLDVAKIYNNYEIKKVEIKEWLSYEEFIKKLLDKLNSYYYDWNKNNNKDDIDFKLATEDLNRYSPKIGMILEDFKQSNILDKKWIDFIEEKSWRLYIKDDLKKEEKLALIDFIKNQKVLNLKDINKGIKYIIYWNNNKFSFLTSKQILWYLHWDIWEFILFFLVEWYLKNPVLFSKVQHSKSSPWDKVKWSDGIHIWYKNWKPNFIFLESKFKNDFSLCLEKTIDSQKEFLEWGISKEIIILSKESSTIDWLWCYGKLFNNWFEEYINPYRRKKIKFNELPFDLVSWIIYELWDDYEYIEKETFKRINNTLKKYKEIEKILGNRKVTIFLLPLVNDEELIKIFLEKIK